MAIVGVVDRVVVLVLLPIHVGVVRGERGVDGRLLACNREKVSNLRFPVAVFVWDPGKRLGRLLACEKTVRKCLICGSRLRFPCGTPEKG